jgi:hypothetical protein
MIPPNSLLTLCFFELQAGFKIAFQLVQNLNLQAVFPFVNSPIVFNKVQIGYSRLRTIPKKVI